MSDVLVRDMEMPKNCLDCDLCYDAFACMGSREIELEWDEMGKKRHADCPLISVPTPHGRLIDADAFDERVRVAGGMSEEELTEDFKDGVQTVLYMLSKQPTIIEAEGSNT